MTPDDAYIELLDRIAASQGRPALFSVEELNCWPQKVVAALKAQNLLTKTRPASHAVCPGCEEACFMPVNTIPLTSVQSTLFIVCDKRDDINRVPVQISRIEQWQASGNSIADLLANLLGLQRSNPIDPATARWEIGVLRGKKHASHVVLVSDVKPTLVLAGHSIALIEVLAFDGGTFKVDKRRLTQLVDQPVTGAGDIESAGQRRVRIKKRVNALKAQGVRAFLKTVAEEEGLSITRIKQLIAEN